jgi:hypothetical protein
MLHSFIKPELKPDAIQSILWDIYPTIPKAIRFGEVEANDEAGAIEKAAQKFKQPVTILMAVRRPWTPARVLNAAHV